MQPNTNASKMLTASGAATLPSSTFASMACSADGKVYIFGGLGIPPYSQEGEATNTLHSVKLRGTNSASFISKFQVESATRQRQRGRVAPGPRSGHTLVYMPAAVAARLRMPGGALLLYGGSDLKYTNFSGLLEKFRSVDAAGWRKSVWDTRVWLFDIASDKWSVLATEGARDRPPGLTFHSATVAGLQVMIYGGIRRADTVELSTDLYVLDFSATTPRWRKATVGNMIVKGAYQMDFPITGIASLPTIGAVVLMNRQVGMICYGAFAERCSVKSRKMHALEIPRSRFI